MKVKRIKADTIISMYIIINAFRTKLQRILHAMHPGFGLDMTRLRYFYRVT